MSNETPEKRPLISDWFGDGEDPARYDPVRTARAAQKRELPKRFYKAVSTDLQEGRHVLLLDGRPARTRLRHMLAASTPQAAALLADEWAAQAERIDPASMPVTRILHAAIDHVTEAAEAVAADIVKYARSDLVCYRAGDPEKLVALESRHWDPVIAHMRDRHGARFRLAEGIGFVEQPGEAIAALAAALEPFHAPEKLAAFHVLTTISGSALIALAVAEGAVTPEAGFAAGEADADFEIALWGADEEAAGFRRARERDFLAAATLLAALGGQGAGR